jgi:hypothetical protein
MAGFKFSNMNRRKRKKKFVKIDKVLVNKAIKFAKDYKKKTGRGLGITGEIGEAVACEKLGLFLLLDKQNSGFDALDLKLRKFQIKSRVLMRRATVLGKFSDHEFDYAIMVLFDEFYNLIGIWKTTYKKIIPIIKKRLRKNPTVNQFKSVAKKVWP